MATQPTQHTTHTTHTTHNTQHTRQVPELAGKDPLILSLETVAEIYLGRISHWNDAAIAEMNPHLKDVLPMQPIMVVSDGIGSETTYQLSKTLSVFAEFNRTVRRRALFLSPFGCFFHSYYARTTAQPTERREREEKRREKRKRDSKHIHTYTHTI